MNETNKLTNKCLELEDPKLNLSELSSYLESSPLAQKHGLIFSDFSPNLSPREVLKICKNLEKLLLEDLTYDELTALFVASSITYLLSDNFQDFEARTELLHKTFRYTNTLDPLHLHVAAKRLHQNLKSASNLLCVCKIICFSSDTGNALAICLVWAMFLDTLNKEIEMYCFHPFSLITELLVSIDINQMLKGNETSIKAHFILQLVSILVGSIVSKSNESFKKAGYSEYFRFELSDLYHLRDWAQKINQNITVSFENSNANYDLITEIKETIAFSIMIPIDDKLKAIDGGLDKLAHSIW